jgi:RND family efflux transporter MFP subunit
MNLGVRFLPLAIVASFAPSIDADMMRIPGITRPVSAVTLSSVIPGTISKIHAGEGSEVNEGELLIELDKRFEELEVERRKIIADGRAELDVAEQRMILLKNEWETTRRLFESTRSISQEDHDRKELEYKLAAAEYERIKMVELQEEVEYRMALEQLGRREIRAPFQGIVTKVYLKAGEGCDPRQPLIELVDARRCEFVSNVRVDLAALLEPGALVNIFIPTGRATPVKMEGRVYFISPVVDQASGLQEIKVRFDNLDRAISPGVDAYLVIDRSRVE